MDKTSTEASRSSALGNFLDDQAIVRGERGVDALLKEDVVCAGGFGESEGKWGREGNNGDDGREWERVQESTEEWERVGELGELGEVRVTHGRLSLMTWETSPILFSRRRVNPKILPNSPKFSLTLGEEFCSPRAHRAIHANVYIDAKGQTEATELQTGRRCARRGRTACAQKTIPKRR